MSEKPLRLPLIAMTSNRGEQTDVDARLINGFMEKTQLDGVWCYKRPGLRQTLNIGTTGGGLTYWELASYSVFGANLYKNGISIGAVTAVGAERYNFASSLGATPRLFMQIGTKAYTTDGATVTQVTDVNYPPVTVPGAVYLDGTTYVMTPEAYILGSDLNDPTSWDPVNSIRVQIDPGRGVAIAKQLNYLVAFKEFSVEAFYDAANAAGSPLGRIESAKLSVGCADGNSVAEMDGALFWLAQSKSGNRSVMMMEALKAKEISTPAVERMLQAGGTMFGSTVHVSGHKFYLLTPTSGSLSAFFTLAYDTDEGLWYWWQSPAGGTLRISAASVDNAAQILVQTFEGKLLALETSTYQDDGVPFSWDLYTPNFDGDTRLGKTLNKLEVTADQQNNSMLEVRWSDDDYQNWSPPRVLDLGLKQAWTTKLGTFVKRAHHFHQTANVPLRIKAVDLHLDLGTL